MTTGRRKQQKGLPKRIGNAVRSTRRDRSLAGLPERKLRRILARNGEAAAREWAHEHLVTETLYRLLEE